MMTSALLHHGVEHLDTVRSGVVRWMEGHEYESIGQMCGEHEQEECAGSGLHERANYMKVLSSYALRSPGAVIPQSVAGLRDPHLPD